MKTIQYYFLLITAVMMTAFASAPVSAQDDKTSSGDTKLAEVPNQGEALIGAMSNAAGTSDCDPCSKNQIGTPRGVGPRATGKNHYEPATPIKPPGVVKTSPSDKTEAAQ